jgi:hypothetical protein
LYNNDKEGREAINERISQQNQVTHDHQQGTKQDTGQKLARTQVGQSDDY